MFQTGSRRAIGWFVAVAIVVSNVEPLGAQEPTLKTRMLDRLLGRTAATETSHASSAAPAPQAGGQWRPELRGSQINLAEGQRGANGPPDLQSAPAVASGPAANSSSVPAPALVTPPPSSAPPPTAAQASVSLETLEQLALANNPTLVQAQAVIGAARGRLVQAGLYPNPTIGYLASEIGNEGRAGQQGMEFTQEIVLGGKLRLSRAVAADELRQAALRAEAQRYRVLNAVRTGFYATLAAERTVVRTKELQELAEKGVKVADELLKGGQGTRPDLLQAEIELDQARIIAENAGNLYRANRRRLAAIIGVPDAELGPLAGDLEHGVADLTSEEAFSRILALSPEVRVAQAGVRRAESALRRARVQPIPNLAAGASVQYDNATRDTIAGVGLRLPLPIFNRNQGNIMAAEAEVLRAAREVDRVRLALTDRFAPAFARYKNSRQQVEKYRTRIVPKAEETLTLVREGYLRGEFPFLQVLTAQRTLAQTSIAYLQALAELRASVVDIQGLLLNDGLAGEATGPADGVAGGRD